MPLRRQPKAVALATGMYTQTDSGKNRISHVIYILGEDGVVYKNTKKGWVTVDASVERAPRDSGKEEPF